LKRPAAKKSTTRKKAPKTARRAPKAERAPEIRRRLEKAYPDARCALAFTNAYQLTVATILSAQCTDKRVNMVTPTLFAKYPDAAALSAAKHEDVEEIIKSTGFFRSKAKSLIGMATAVDAGHKGEIPSTMDELVRLPGVGRKTANVVLGNAFSIDEGVVVDTHVSRVSQRLGLTRQTDPVKIEADLMALFPREGWTMLSHLMIEHGRQICDARKPKCEVCPLSDICPSSRV
jgi:endonuclease-3